MRLTYRTTGSQDALNHAVPCGLRPAVATRATCFRLVKGHRRRVLLSGFHPIGPVGPRLEYEPPPPPPWQGPLLPGKHRYWKDWHLAKSVRPDWLQRFNEEARALKREEEHSLRRVEPVELDYRLGTRPAWLGEDTWQGPLLPGGLRTLEPEE